MCKVIMIGCDLHDATMVLKAAVGSGPDFKKTFPTSQRAEMIAWMRELAAQEQAQRTCFVYEASGQGFGLRDDLCEAGIECHVLAPSHLPHTQNSRKRKTDDRDAQMLLDELRAHVLAGRKLPAVWIPDRQTRDDREAVRLRLETAAERTRVKNRIKNLLKRWQVALPKGFTASGDWSKRSLAWLDEVAAGTGSPEQAGGLGAGTAPVRLGTGGCAALGSLVAAYRSFTSQIQTLDKAIETLARTPRYVQAFRKLKLLPGVGTLSAMVFLTELGDLERFANRRKLGTYLGLTPSSYESGERDDRKGHITRQGSSQVRHVLCQAAWAALRCSSEWRARYDRIKRGSKSRSKVAIVAVMRQLAVTMWQVARSKEWDALLPEETASARAQQKGGPPHPPRRHPDRQGRGRGDGEAEGAGGTP